MPRPPSNAPLFPLVLHTTNVALHFVFTKSSLTGVCRSAFSKWQCPLNIGESPPCTFVFSSSLDFFLDFFPHYLAFVSRLRFKMRIIFALLLQTIVISTKKKAFEWHAVSHFLIVLSNLLELNWNMGKNGAASCHVGQTGTHSINEVEQRWDRIVLGWVWPNEKYCYQCTQIFGPVKRGKKGC